MTKKKIFFFIIILFFLNQCGFNIDNQKKFENLIFSKVELVGDKDLKFHFENKMNFKKTSLNDIRGFKFTAKILDLSENIVFDSRGIATEERVVLTIIYEVSDTNNKIVFEDTIKKDKRINIGDNTIQNNIIRYTEKKILLDRIIFEIKNNLRFVL